ncbi:multicopper oxidase domain-containing protein [Streptacidiphilus melanogenes]|nr:multicopper oxidase domain-containing protein [Streptacidiphilus melanogenes]
MATLGQGLHVFHVHGRRWRSGDRIYHCHITDHMMGGMVGRYLVEP